MAARLTPLSKFLITAVVLGGIGTLVYKNKDKLAGLAPEAEKPKSNVPPIATLPDDPGPAVARRARPAAPTSPRCASITGRGTRRPG